MSASGPWRTCAIASQMSAFGGKADTTSSGDPLSRLLLGGNRTWLFATHMSAYDPKRTSDSSLNEPRLNRYDCSVQRLGGRKEATRVHQACRRCGGRIAVGGARTAAGDTGDWISR